MTITTQKTCHNCKQIINQVVGHWIMIQNSSSNNMVTLPTCNQYCNDQICTKINNQPSLHATKIRVDWQLPEQHDDPFA